MLLETPSSLNSMNIQIVARGPFLAAGQPDHTAVVASLTSAPAPAPRRLAHGPCSAAHKEEGGESLLALSCIAQEPTGKLPSLASS